MAKTERKNKRTKRCAECGAEIPKDATFCEYCGKKFVPSASVPFFKKLFKAAILDSKLYETVEGDTRAVKHALFAILLVNGLSGLGKGLYAYYTLRIQLEPQWGFWNLIVSSAIIYISLALVKWVFLTSSMYLLGVGVAGGTATFGEVGRTVAFAYAPICLQILVPAGLFLGATFVDYFVLATNVWMIAAMVIAIRESLDLPFGTIAAFAVTAAGGLLYGLLKVLVITPILTNSVIYTISIAVVTLALVLAILIVPLVYVSRKEEHAIPERR